MKDFNFFSPYKITANKNEASNNFSEIVVAAVAVAFIGSIIFVTLFQLIRVTNLNKNRSELISAMEDPKYKERLAVAQEQIKSADELKTEKMFFADFRNSMIKIHQVNEYIIRFIAKEMINDMFFVELSIDDTEIKILGRALNKRVIAQFENDLRKTGKFEDVRISEIKRPEDDDGSKYYDFVITLITKR